jgi:hypothetical protein
MQADQQAAALLLRHRWSRVTTVTAAARAAYTPQYAFGLPAASNSAPEIAMAPPAGPALELASLRSVDLGGAIGIDRRMSAATTVGLRSSATRTVFLDQDRAVANTRLAARIERRIGARLAVQARYEFGSVDNTGGMTGATALRTHEADLGVRYTPRWSSGTTVTATVTPAFSARSAVSAPRDAGESTAATAGGPRLGGSAFVDQAWSGGVRLGAGYWRGFYTDPAYALPAFVQTASARLSIDRGGRLAWSGAVSRSSGGAAGSTTIPDNVGYSASARYRLAPRAVVTGEYQQVVLERRDAIGAGSWRRLDSRRLRLGLVLDAGRW